MFSTSKNKNIVRRSKETCANESDHISLLHDLMMSSALNVYFSSVSLQPKTKRSY